MNPEQRVKVLEEEVSVLKNEIKAVLLDIREHYLNYQNPFAHGGASLGNDSELPLDESPEERVQSVELGGDEPPPKVEKVGSEEAGSEEELTPMCPVNSPDEARRQSSRDKSKVDLITIAGLTQWVDQATVRIGKDRAEALVEVGYTMGRLSSGFREVLVRLVRLSPSEHANGRVTARDYLAVLVQLEGFLGRSTQPETTLLSILSNDGEGGQP